MTADVVAFLRAALDEVERVAGAAAVASPHPNHEAWWQSGGWEADELHVHAADEGGGPGAQGTREEAAHIALHDPRAALARVQAERFILELHEGSHECSSWNEMHREYDNCRWIVDGGCSTVYALAYGHRHTIPGYDPAWAPEDVSADAR